ncbi:MAG: hypothetical protein ABIG96_03175 [Candidatus Micrarchaeota archaeon]
MPSRKTDGIDVRLGSIERELLGVKSSLSFLTLMVTMILALLLGAIIKLYFG